MAIVAGLWRRDGALIVSVGLNAFLLAFLGVHLLRPYVVPAARPPGMVGRIVAGLPADVAAAFQAQLDQHRAEYQPARDRIDAARLELGRALAASPFDEAAVRAALEAYQQSWHGFAARFDDAFLAAIAALPPDARARAAAMAVASQP